MHKGKKIYYKPPLPFWGQKRYFVNNYRIAVDGIIPGNGEGWTVVDVFGGSGLLSYWAKKMKPGARVVYNDFDNYMDRLKNIGDTNILREQLVDFIAANGLEFDKKIPKKTKLHAELIDIIKRYPGYKDYVSLCSWFLFPGRDKKTFSAFTKLTLWPRIPKQPITVAGYLEGLEIVHADFRTVIQEFSGGDKTLFVLDPPYPGTLQNSYTDNGSQRFSDDDFNNLISMVSRPFILFFSDTSNISDQVIDKMKPFRSFEHCTSLSKSKYIDKMIHTV